MDKSGNYSRDWGLGLRFRVQGRERRNGKENGQYSIIADDMVVFQNRGPQYKPQHTTLPILGTPKMLPLIFA